MSDSVRPHRRKPTRLPCTWDSPGKNTGVGCHFLLQCMKVKREREVAQSCPTLSDPIDCSPPGSSIYGIFQARGLEWGGILNFKASCLYGPCLCECWEQLGAVECSRWRGVWLQSEPCFHLSTPGKLEKRSQKKGT